MEIRTLSSQIEKKAGRKPGRVHRFFARLGPGLITGAADDDPSGISTYSVTGASFGFAQNLKRGIAFGDHQGRRKAMSF